MPPVTGATKVSLRELADLAIGTPEVGAVNFNALHALIVAILKNLHLQDTRVDFQTLSPEQSRSFESPRASISTPQLAMRKERRRSSLARMPPQTLESQVKDLGGQVQDLGGQVQDLGRQLKAMDNQVQGIMTHIQYFTGLVGGLDLDSPEWLGEQEKASELPFAEEMAMPITKMTTSISEMATPVTEVVTPLTEKATPTIEKAMLQMTKSVPLMAKPMPQMTKTTPEMAKATPEVMAKATPKTMAKAMMPQMAKAMPEMAKMTPEMMAKVMPEMMAKMTPEMMAKVMPEMVKAMPEMAKMTPEMAKMTPEMMAKMTPEMMAKVMPEMMAKMTPEMMAKVMPEMVKAMPQMAKVMPEMAKAMPQMAKVTPEMMAKMTPEMAKVMPQMAKVTPEMMAKVTPEMMAKVTPEMMAKMTPEMMAKMTPEMMAKMTPEMVAKMTPEMMTKVTFAMAKPMPEMTKAVPGMEMEMPEVAMPVPGMATLMPEKARVGLMKIWKDHPQVAEVLQSVVEDVRALKEAQQKEQEFPEFNPVHLLQRIEDVERIVRDREELLEPFSRKMIMLPAGEEVTMVTWEELEQAITDGWKAAQGGLESTPGLLRRKGKTSLLPHDSPSGASSKHPSVDQSLDSAGGFGPDRTLPGTSRPGYPSEGGLSTKRSRPTFAPGFPDREQYPRVHDEVRLAKPYQPPVSQFRIEPDHHGPEPPGSTSLRRDKQGAFPGPRQQELARDAHHMIRQPHGSLSLSTGQVDARPDQYGAGPPGLDQPELVPPSIYPHGTAPFSMSQLGMMLPGMDEQGLVLPGMGQQGVVPPWVPGRDQQGLELPGAEQPGMVPLSAYQPGVGFPGTDQLAVERPAVDKSAVGPLDIGQHGFAIFGMDQQGLVAPLTDQQGFVQPSVETPGFIQPGSQQQDGIQPGVGQPGLVQPGMDQPGLVQPGAGQPGLVQPGMDQPGLVQPGAGQPGLVQPGAGQPGLVQPGAGQPGLVQPGMDQPGLVQPGAGQPGVVQLGMDQPGLVQPGAGQPGLVQPGMDQPGLVQPGAGQPGVVQPGMDQRGLVQPGTGQPGVVQPGMDQRGLVQPGAGQPGLVQPGMDQRGLVQPGAGQPGLVQPGAGQPGVVQPGVGRPGLVQPGMDQHGLVQPGMDQRGLVQPGAGQPGLVQPGAGQPGLVQPGMDQRGLVQPGAGQPGLVQPGAGQPGLVQPGAGQPGLVQPGMDQRGLVQPGAGQPGLVQPGAGQPGLAQPGAGQPGLVQPGMDQGGLVQPGAGQPGLAQPGAGQPGLAQPGAGQPGLVQLGVDQRGLVQTGTYPPGLVAQPGAYPHSLVQSGAYPRGLVQPGVAGQFDLVQPGPGQPGLVQPGVDQHGLVQPGAYPPGLVQPGAYPHSLVQPGAYPRGLVHPRAYPRALVQPGVHPPAFIQPGTYHRGLVQPGLDQYGSRPPGADHRGFMPSGFSRPYQHGGLPGRDRHTQVSPLLTKQGLMSPAVDQQGLVPAETYQQGLMPPGTDQRGPAPLSTHVESARPDQIHPSADTRGLYAGPLGPRVDHHVPASLDPDHPRIQMQITPSQDSTFSRSTDSLHTLGQVSSERSDEQVGKHDSLEKVAPSFPIAVETFRLMGELTGLYMELKENMKTLDEAKAGHSDLEKIQYLLSLMVQKTMPPDLQEQLKTIKALTKEVRQEKAKVDRMQRLLEGEVSLELGKEMQAGQLGMQLSLLRASVADIEKELAELRESQERGKVSMEHSVSEASLYLQDQLDKLRTIIENMLASSSTLLSMSMAPQKAPVALLPGQIDPEATCPACSLDLSHQVSTLVQRYEQLQNMVNSLAASRPSKKAKLQSQDEELLGHVQSSILQVQGDCEKLNVIAGNLIEDHRQKQKDIDVLYQGIEKLEKEKANREHLEMEIDVKADKSALASKVSRIQFDATTEQLNHMMQELVAKMSGQEQDWQKMLDRLLTEMDSKLDRLELDPVKQLLEDRWKSLRQQLKERSPLYQADEAACMRRQLLAHFHCLSCDRPLETPVTGQIIPATPVGQSLPGHRSSRPYTIFELEQVRQQGRNLKLGSSPFQRADLASMERSVGRLRTMHSKMLMDIEKVQIHFGGSVKASSQMIHELLQAQCLGSPCCKRRTDMSDYTYSTVSRHCGGSHTRTYPYRRNRLQHLPQGLCPEDIQLSSKHHEVDILGLDGHIYKGRMDTRLPGIPSKDSSGNIKHKVKQSRSLTHRQPSLCDSSQLPSRPQSAQLLAGNTSATRQQTDRPVSSEGRFPQPNVAHLPSPSEMARGPEMHGDVSSGEGLEEPTRGPRSSTAH